MRPTIALSALVLAVSTAHAEEPVPLHVAAVGLDPAPIAAALADELATAVEVVPPEACARPCVLVRQDGAAATVEVTLGDAAPLARTIGLPADAGDARDVIVLLAANLARDEAAALLAELDDAGPVTTPGPLPPAPAPPPVLAPPPASSATPAPVAAPAPRLGRERRGGSFSLGLVPFVSVSTPGGGHTAGSVDLLVGVRERLGVGVAGVASVVRRDVAGAQLAGVAAVARGPVHGLQAGGVAAVAGAVHGAQLGGVAAVSHASVHGVQLGGVAVAARRGATVQLAGVAAVAGGDVGLQVSGVANVARGTVRGAQLGLVNVAGTSHGLQVGLVNVARKGDGAALGLINVVPGGRTELEGTLDQDAFGTLVLRHGGRRFHNVYGIGGRARGVDVGGELDGDDVFTYGLGLGPTLYQGRVTVDLDVMAWHVLYGDQRPWGERSPGELNLLAQTRLVVGAPVGPAHLVVGAAFNTFVTTDATRTDFRARVAPGATPMDPGDDAHVTMWPTVFAGLRL